MFICSILVISGDIFYFEFRRIENELGKQRHCHTAEMFTKEKLIV